MAQQNFPRRFFLYKLLAAAYSILLGLVLPFICWGTLATPGHPHRTAHLVFFKPPILAEMQVKQAALEHAQHHMGTPDAKQSAPAQQPIGRSIPDQLSSAISIVSPLFVVQILLVFAPLLIISMMSRTSDSHLFDPRVLTPPPRRLYL